MDEARSSMSPTGPKSPPPFSPTSPNSLKSGPLPPPPYKAPMFVSSSQGPSLQNEYSTVQDVDEFKGNSDYAELNDLPLRNSVTSDTKTSGAGTVSKTKFDLVMEKLRTIQVG